MGQNPTEDSDGERTDHSRRTFLGTLGVGLGVNWKQFGLSRERKTRIVKARDKDRKPLQTDKVKSGWVRHTEALFNHLEGVKNRFLSNQTIVGIGITGIESSNYGPQIPVPLFITSVDPEGLDIPNKLSEVSSVKKADLVRDLILFEKGEEIHPVQAACYGTTTPSPYPGGLPVTAYNAAGDSGQGTGGYRATKNGTEYLISANHITQSCPGDSWDFAARWESTKLQDIGPVQDASVNGDWVAVSANNTGVTDLANKIWNSGSTKSISGYKTKTGMSADLNEQTVKKHGGATGSTSGKVTNMGLSIGLSDSCGNTAGEGFKADIDAAGGDSGGPMFETHVGSFSSYHIVWGHLIGGDGSTNGTSCIGTDIYTKSVGVAGYYLVNQKNFSIG